MSEFTTMSDTVTNGVVRDRMLSRNGIIVAFLIVACGLINVAPANGQSVDVFSEALEALYSLDFDVAEQKFTELTEDDPTVPRYWNLLASSVWLKIVFEQEKLNLDSYMGNRLGGDGANDLVSSEREARLRTLIGRVIETAETILENNPNDIEALYALGVAHGMLASFEATVKRAYFAANSQAGKAREYHMRVLQIDASYNDARLTIGTYDYALGVLPGFVRFFLGLFGVRGDKEGGIEQLEYAAELGERSRTNAKMVLVVVYNREKQYEKALAVLHDLHTQYPRNFLLETATASVYERTQAWEDAIEVYKSVLSKVRSGQDGYDRLDPEPLLFKIGEANVRRLELDQAIESFQTLLDGEDANDDIKGRAHLWMGKVLDLRQERTQALAEYEAVLALDCDEDLKDEARRYQRRSFTDV